MILVLSGNRTKSFDPINPINILYHFIECEYSNHIYSTYIYIYLSLLSINKFKINTRSNLTLTMQYLDYLNFLLINITFKIVTCSILLWNVTQLSTVTQISLLLDIIALLKIRHETLTSDYIRVTNAKLFTRYTDFFLLHIDRCATKKKTDK